MVGVKRISGQGSRAGESMRSKPPYAGLENVVQVVPHISAETLQDFVEDMSARSTIYTDGRVPPAASLNVATSTSPPRSPPATIRRTSRCPPSIAWPRLQNAGCLAPATAAEAQHAEAYLDEFVFRFNRRTSASRELLFYRLVENAVAIRKLDYEGLITIRKAQAGKRRGGPRCSSRLGATSGEAAALIRSRPLGVVDDRQGTFK
jgi:hypothetical protein